MNNIELLNKIIADVYGGNATTTTTPEGETEIRPAE